MDESECCNLSHRDLHTAIRELSAEVAALRDAQDPDLLYRAESAERALATARAERDDARQLVEDMACSGAALLTLAENPGMVPEHVRGNMRWGVATFDAIKRLLDKYERARALLARCVDYDVAWEDVEPDINAFLRDPRRDDAPRCSDDCPFDDLEVHAPTCPARDEAER